MAPTEFTSEQLIALLEKSTVSDMAAIFAAALDHFAREMAASAEQAVRTRAARAAALGPAPARGVITLTGRKRGVGRERVRCTLYVTGCSFKPGDGWAVSKVSYSPDRSKAHTFAGPAAEGIAKYLVSCGWLPGFETL